MKKLLSILALFIVSLMVVSMVSAASVSTLGSLTSNDVVVLVNDKEAVNGAFLTVEEGKTLDIEVELFNTGNVDAEQIEVVARLSGYEYSDYENLEDSTHVFDVKAGSRKSVRLSLVVPNDLDNGENTLRIFVLDRNSNEISQTFKLNVESPRHSVSIEDVVFSPSNTVKAGRSLLTTVLLENFGAKDEDNVKVTVSVPELGVSANEFVDLVASGNSEDVPEMFLTIPATTAEGDYQVDVTIKYDNLRETVTKSYTIKVLENEMFQTSDKLILAVGPTSQTVATGKTATYAVALTNEGLSSKAFLLEMTSGDWATATVSDSLVVLEPGKNQVVYVDVAVAANAATGKHVASLAVKSGDEVLETVALNADVTSAVSNNGFSLRNGLEVALIVLVVLLVIIGLIIGFSRLRKDDEEDEEQTYY